MAEEKDSLRSKSFAQLLDMVSEGEIEGLVDGLKSVYLDDTPLIGPDGNYNFKDVVVQSVNGTNTQDAIAGFPSSESETLVGVEVTQASPVTRTITSENVNAVNVRISLPQMSFTDLNTGDIRGTSDIRTAQSLQ